MEKLFISRSDYEAIKNGKDVLIVVEAKGESPMYARVLSYAGSLEKVKKKLPDQSEFPMEKHRNTTTDAASMNEAFNNMLRDKYPNRCPTAPTECNVQLVKDSMKFLKESLNSAAEYADYMARSAQETYDMFHKNEKEE